MFMRLACQPDGRDVWMPDKGFALPSLIRPVTFAVDFVGRMGTPA